MFKRIANKFLISKKANNDIVNCLILIKAHSQRNKIYTCKISNNIKIILHQPSIIKIVRLKNNLKKSSHTVAICLLKLENS